jgi:positive regulator of sigma E activity
MIEQNVQVVRCEEEQLWVRMGTQTGCTACDSGKGCGAGVFAKLLQRKPVVLELARNDLDVKTGQMLTLAFPEQLYLKLIFSSYGWPLLAALSGALAGYWLAGSQLWDAVLVDAATLAGGLLTGTLAIRFFKNRNNADNILKSLRTTVYYPSSHPNMCKKGQLDTT